MKILMELLGEGTRPSIRFWVICAWCFIAWQQYSPNKCTFLFIWAVAAGASQVTMFLDQIKEK